MVVRNGGSGGKGPHPECYSQQYGAKHHRLIPRHRAHLPQPRRCSSWCLWCCSYGWRPQYKQQTRHCQQHVHGGVGGCGGVALQRRCNCSLQRQLLLLRTNRSTDRWGAGLTHSTRDAACGVPLGHVCALYSTCACIYTYTCCSTHRHIDAHACHIHRRAPSSAGTHAPVSQRGKGFASGTPAATASCRHSRFCAAAVITMLLL